MFKNQSKTAGSLSALLVGVGALAAPGMLAPLAVLAAAMNSHRQDRVQRLTAMVPSRRGHGFASPRYTFEWM